MRKCLAIILLAVSFSAQAVDLTLTLTAAQATRLQAAVGEERALKDTQTPPQPRSATPAEVKQFVIDRLREFLYNHERSKAVDAANQAIVVPTFDPL